MLCGRHVRRFGGSTPKVISAQAKLHGPQVDRAMPPSCSLPEGIPARSTLDVVENLPRFTVKVVGDRGELRLHPLIPFQRFSVRSTNGNRVENFPRHSTYANQLDAFAAAVLRGEPVKTTPEEAIEK